MTVHTGRKVNVGIGIESTRGTKVAPARYYSHTDFQPQDRVEYKEHEGNVGTLAKTFKKEIARKYSEIPLKGVAGIESLGFFLYAMFGTVSSAETSGGGAYQHDFTMNESNLQKTLTISEKNGVESLAYAMCAIEKLSFDLQQDSYVTLDSNFKGKHSENATFTPAYSDEFDFMGRNIEIFFADNEAGLDGATAICVESGTIELMKQIEQVFCLWEVEPKDVVTILMDLQSNLTIRHKDNTFSEYYKNGTKKAMRIRMSDANTTIGTEDNPTLDIDVPQVSFDDVIKEGGKDDIRRQNITISGLFDLSASALVKAKLLNTTATYS